MANLPEPLPEVPDLVLLMNSWRRRARRVHVEPPWTEIVPYGGAVDPSKSTTPCPGVRGMLRQSRHR